MQFVERKKQFVLLLRALRVNQWIKNLVIFTAIIFSGQLFNVNILTESVKAFFAFCLLSSTSYVLNDIIDYEYDKRHPLKKKRPIASGAISIPEATFMVFIMTLSAVVISLLFFSIQFFFLSLLFILLHFFYSLYLKRYPVIDIFSISFSFVIRALAGEVATGFHIPIWLLLTIFFLSLFMATVKRHAELLTQAGRETRASLVNYKEHLLNFLTTTFATTTIIAYSSYAYFEKLPPTKPLFGTMFDDFNKLEARRWIMITIPFIVYAISRYAQLLYERDEGEAPEKIIVRDRPLMATIFLWVTTVVVLIYVL